MKKSISCEIIFMTEPRENLIDMTVEAPEIAAAALPGQFLHIACGEPRVLRRPISICDATGGQVRFCFEVRGEGTKWLAGRRPGQKLEIMGPLGNGFPKGIRGPVLMIGGGIGAFPLYMAARRQKGGSDAALGFAAAEKVVMQEDFEAACQTVRFATDDGSFGTAGNAVTVAKDMLEQRKYSAAFCCGPAPMLRAAAALCEEKGVPCYVSLEQRMGCGVGACLVCACEKENGEYAKVCADGPVFLSSEVKL